MRPFSRALAVAFGTLCVCACGESPTEPNRASAAFTTVKITVTECSLGGSVVVRSDGVGNEPVTLATPGEVTLRLTPGPHALSYQRGEQVFAASVSGPADPLASIPSGGTASIALVNPPGACMTTSQP